MASTSKRLRATLIGLVALTTSATVAIVAAAESAPNWAGSEIRRSARMGGEVRHDVLRLAPDGTLTGNYLVEARLVARGGYAWEGAVSGRWSVENGRLCLEGDGIESGGRVCLRVEKTGASEFSDIYTATDTATGLRWQMFVSRASGR